MKRAIILLVFLIAICCVCYIWNTANRTEFIEEEIDKVTIGMSEDDIERLLHAKAGDYSKKSDDDIWDCGFLMIPESAELPTDCCYKDWLGPTVGIRVWFDSDQVVKAYAKGDVFYYGVNLNSRYDQSLWERVKTFIVTRFRN